VEERLNLVLPQSQEVRAEEATPIHLEIVRGQGKGEALQFPVRIKSLAAGEGILEGYRCPEELDIRELVGREVIIHTPATEAAPSSEVRGWVLWARPGAGPGPDLFLGLGLAEPDLEVPKSWQEQMALQPGDVEGLWNLWDQLQEEQRDYKSDQTFYLLGTLAILGGLILGFFGPEASKFWGFLAAIYGSLLMGGKSLWSLWRNRGKARDPYKSNHLGG
jgi:hypothetical protein